MPYFDAEHPQGTESSVYTLPDFAFENQDGVIYTLDSLKGKVWLAAFFDLRNEHLAKITERLLMLNWKYRDEQDIAIVCFSTDCENDAAPLLKEYVQRNQRYNVSSGKWQFLTGNQAAMQSFFRNGFYINDISNEPIFRLVDASGHIRGIYGNTEYHMENAIEDIALLKKESDKRKYEERKKAKSEH